MSTWVFLRGLTRDSRHWGEFPERFRQAIAAVDAGGRDATVVLLDLPGNGVLNRQQSPASVAAMAEYCRSELTRRAVAPPYHLLAMSLGAMVAIAWVDRHPGDLRGCVLINTSLRPFNPFWQRLRPQNYARLLGLVVPGASADEREETILQLTSTLAASTAAGRASILAAWGAWRRERPVASGNAWRQLWAAARYRAPSAKPALRLLILAGAGDSLVDPRCSRQLARRWSGDFAEHPAAGHDLPLDDGDWVAARVRDWLLREQDLPTPPLICPANAP
jgi:pimeloyl-ACP methyl ester carboxylesterase